MNMSNPKNSFDIMFLIKNNIITQREVKYKNKQLKGVIILYINELRFESLICNSYLLFEGPEANPYPKRSVDKNSTIIS